MEEQLFKVLNQESVNQLKLPLDGGAFARPYAPFDSTSFYQSDFLILQD